jgi:hypothetical protein
MARIPIYQMAFGQNDDHESGLIFTSELPENSMPSIIFTIPVPSNFRHPMDFEDFFYFNTFHFPCFIDNEYLEIEAKVSFPEMLFNVPNTDFQIAFDIDTDASYYWRYFPFRIRKRRNLRYVGKEKRLILNNDGFLTLLPTDILEMDELYLKHKGIFVGLTPNFGNIENFSLGE